MSDRSLLKRLGLDQIPEDQLAERLRQFRAKLEAERQTQHAIYLQRQREQTTQLKRAKWSLDMSTPDRMKRLALAHLMNESREVQLKALLEKHAELETRFQLAKAKANYPQQPPTPARPK